MVPDASRVSAQYGSLSIPVAIMTGDGDKVIDPEQADKLRRAIPHGTLQILHGIGHRSITWPRRRWSTQSRRSPENLPTCCPGPNTLVRATKSRVESSARPKIDEILMDKGKGPVRLSTRRAS